MFRCSRSPRVQKDRAFHSLPPFLQAAELPERRQGCPSLSCPLRPPTPGIHPPYVVLLPEGNSFAGRRVCVAFYVISVGANSQHFSPRQTSLPPSEELPVGNQIKGLSQRGRFQVQHGRLRPLCPELANERAVGPHPPRSAAVKGPLCDRGGIRQESQCSLVRRASWSCREAGSPAGRCRRKRAILRWFPWPSGPGGGSHISRPELEPGLLPQQTWPRPRGGQECKSQEHRPPWDTPAPRQGDAGGWMGLARKRQALSVRMKFKCAVTGDSLLPVILKLSASHIWEVLLNSDLLEGRG